MSKIKTEAKRLVFDIERIKGSFRKQYRGLDIQGEFWGLSDYKHVIGRIYPDEVTEWPRTICVAWRFIGDKQIERFQPGRDFERFRAVRCRLDAVVVVGKEGRKGASDRFVIVDDEDRRSGRWRHRGSPKEIARQAGCRCHVN